MQGGLGSRTVVASGLLAIVVVAVFGIMLGAIGDLRDSEERASATRAANIAAEGLEKLAIDLETGQRGFVITGDERFLEPWKAARAAFRSQATDLLGLTREPDQSSRARRLARGGESYIDNYSIPLVAAARRNEPSARSTERTTEGKRRMDALRADFARFRAVGRGRAATRQEAAEADARRAVLAGAAGLAGSLVLIVLYGTYLMRGFARPVRRTAAAAGQLAAGDLSVRVPERGPGEIGDLQHAFNVMGGSLEANRDALRLAGDEQAALRRVATLVARGAPPTEVFASVAQEVGQILEVDFTLVSRYDEDRVVEIVGGWSRAGPTAFVGARTKIGGNNVSTLVFERKAPARVDHLADDAMPMTAIARTSGARSSAGAPITVSGRLWGVMIVAEAEEGTLPVGIEHRLAAFTELVATAIANAEGQAELMASRARVVATADETRRRIERDLHDGVQQRLVSLGLQLGAVRAAVPSGLDDLSQQLDWIAAELDGSLDELLDFARGIHPRILARGGLRAALGTLARHSPVQVNLDVHASDRLPEPVEVAAYFVVSEALTNASKHAQATCFDVDVEADADALRVQVHDDGVGGAQFAGGSGLVGLRDRVEALGGRISLQSKPGAGTSIRVVLPLSHDSAAAAP
jgi:signal transduction histidine kinase/CHASE3 domain sensor protein